MHHEIESTRHMVVIGSPSDAASPLDLPCESLQALGHGIRDVKGLHILDIPCQRLR